MQDFARRRCDGSIHLLDLDALVRQTIEVTRHKWESLDHARGTPIHVAVHTDAKARVNGSPNELREVLTNLVFNAVDAMPEGGTLTVRTWSEGPSIFFSVSDTGTGIAEAVQRRLFEPFFTTKGERGNGLGLSVSFGIVRRHGGDDLGRVPAEPRSDFYGPSAGVRSSGSDAEHPRRSARTCLRCVLRNRSTQEPARPGGRRPGEHSPRSSTPG